MSTMNDDDLLLAVLRKYPGCDARRVGILGGRPSLVLAFELDEPRKRVFAWWEAGSGGAGVVRVEDRPPPLPARP